MKIKTKFMEIVKGGKLKSSLGENIFLYEYPYFTSLFHRLNQCVDKSSGMLLNFSKKASFELLEGTGKNFVC